MHEDSKASEKASLKDSGNVEDGEESEIQEKKTYRQRLAAFLQSNAVQYTVIAFVVIDGLIVILELLIDLDIIKFPDEGDSHDALNATHDNSTFYLDDMGSTYSPLMVMPDTHHENGGHHHTKHHGGRHHHNHHNEHSIVTQTIATVTHYLLNSTQDEYDGNVSLHGNGHGDDHHETHHGGHHGAHHHSNKEIAEHTLHHCSLAILCIFLVEVICKIIAEGKHLLKHKAEVLDAFVVVISFTLDVVFSFVDVAQAAKDAAGLMVMLRLWRVTRLINGVIISVQMEADKKIHKIEMVLHATEKENEKLRDQLKLLQEELDMLRNKLKLTDDKRIGSDCSQSTSHSVLQNVSQKTDDDVIDILMGWDSPQFLNSHSAQTPLTPSPATTAPVKELKSSSASQSSKSMFMVFEDKDKNPSSLETTQATVIGPKPPVFVVPVDEESPKHMAVNAGLKEENHPHQILNFPQTPSRKGSKEDQSILSSIQPYISPTYPVPESATKKRVDISPSLPTAPRTFVEGPDQNTRLQSPPSSSVDAPRKPSVSSSVDQRNDSPEEQSKLADVKKKMTLSDPQMSFPKTSLLPGGGTPPANATDQVIPLLPPPASKRSSEGRKKSTPTGYTSPNPNPPAPKIETREPSPPVATSSPETKSPRKLTSGLSLEDTDRDSYGNPQKDLPSPPAAIILAPVSSVGNMKKAPQNNKNGQNSDYVPLKSPRQSSPPPSPSSYPPPPPPIENVFWENDNSSRSSSFLGDAMSDAPPEKDPGAPR